MNLPRKRHLPKGNAKVQSETRRLKAAGYYGEGTT